MRGFIAGLLLLIHGAAWPADASTPRSRAEEFLGSLQGGDVASAYDNLFKGSSIPEAKPQAVAALKQQTTSILPLYGKVLGSELVTEETFGSSVTRLVYIVRLEKAPTIWEFYFYKSKAEWFLANIQFGDQFALLGRKK